MGDYVPRYPSIATCEALRDYLEWHCQNGHNKDPVELRNHLLAIPPKGLEYDEDLGVVVVSGIAGAV